jgi:hypothetical protein
MAQARSLAKTLLGILRKDLPRLERIDRYARGDHDAPYTPTEDDGEYRLLARRSVTNWLALVVATPAQALYVDSVRRVRPNADPDRAVSAESAEAEMEHWQRSGLDARQLAIHQAALTYGHSFVVTEQGRDRRWRTRGLSPLRTVAIFEDPAADVVPVAALTVIRKPSPDALGLVRVWDALRVYDFTIKSTWDAASLRQVRAARHGASECPVTRLAASVDLDGRTTGIVEPLIPVQDKANQTSYDLLVAQTYSSTMVRWGSGLTPPVQRDPETGEPVLDEQGNKIPVRLNLNARRFLFAEDPSAKFGSLPPSPLNGLIDANELGVRHMAALSQVPPHYMVGLIPNLPAEALQAAEISLMRKVGAYQSGFSVPWERVFRLVASVEGRSADADDYSLEVVWRDMESRALAQSADGLGKLSATLGIPARGLWPRVPGVTDAELRYWDRLTEESDYRAQLASLLLPAAEENAVPSDTGAVNADG